MGAATPSTSQSRVVVFRATDAYLLDMVQGVLESEGLEPRRLGRTNAALMGGGDSAFEQLIDVPEEHAASARTLIEASDAPVDEDELTRQALSAEGAEMTGVADADLGQADAGEDEPDRGAFRPLAEVTAAAFLYFWGGFIIAGIALPLIKVALGGEFRTEGTRILIGGAAGVIISLFPEGRAHPVASGLILLGALVAFELIFTAL